MTDAPKPDGLERESWWKSSPVVHIVRRVAPAQRISTDPGYEPGSPQALALARSNAAAVAAAPQAVVATSDSAPQTAYADWTPANLAAHEENVEVFSNCEEVELFLNGTSLGSKPINADASARRWTVPFAPGSLQALARNHGKQVASETLRTAGKPARIALSVERARLSSSFDDVAYLRATVVDEQGTRVPTAAVSLTFSAGTSGQILATASGDVADHSGFQHPDRTTFQGAAIALVRAAAASGTVTVTASSPGLQPASTTLQIAP
jgi:beta-galactosidase